MASDYGQRFLPKESTLNVIKNFEEGKSVRVAGRIMTRRIMGKSAFFDVKDEFGRIQAYVKKDILGEEGYAFFKALSIGDIVGLEGDLFSSKTGEKTIKVRKLERLSKIVRTLPEKWHGLKDVETRYRHRYIDLIMNDNVRETFKTRSSIIREIRKMLDEKNFTEVETPMMQSIPGGARAKPFETHHHALHADLYLRVAPELYLKRLLVGGFEKVYEINRNFRNEGISIKHNPEFTMMELYEAYADYEDMMNLTEEIVSGLVKKLYGKEEIVYGDKTINFKTPWKRITFYESIKKATGLDLRKMSVKDAAKELKIEVKKGMDEVDILDEIFSEKVEKDLWDPTFILDYPVAMTALAKGREDDPELVYRFELFIGKKEIANAFSELNDPEIQRKRLTEQKEIIGAGKEIDEDFLMALEYGMPPAGGLGIGIDRLVMLLTNQNSIRDVILFPQLRPEKKKED